MPVSDAQLKAINKWNLNNPEKVKELKKKATMKWRENNKEYYTEVQREAAINYYYAHKEEILQKKRIYYQEKKLAKLEKKDEINEI